MSINLNGSLDADLVPADFRVNKTALATHRSSLLAGSLVARGDHGSGTRGLVLVGGDRCGGSLGVDLLASAGGDGGGCGLDQGDDSENGDDGGDLHVGLRGEERLLG